ncbi:MAG TPA: OmpA family protein [Candidatus Binatia bacterium]|nr:OmpA family protein [Candidatus Binatia bacterium]
MRSFKPAAVAALASLALSGCSVMQERQWSTCAIGGAVIGATAGGIAGGVTANNTGGGNGERGGAIAGGIVGGGLLGALLGHVVCDPVKPPPPPPPVAQAPPPPPPPQKIVELHGPEFDFDKATLRPEGRHKVDEAVRVLKENPGMRVAINGYTDGVGTEAYNLKLSERRARAVADYMVSQGIDRSRLTVRGFGKADPVASNDTAEGRARNRRVEIVKE